MKESHFLLAMNILTTCDILALAFLHLSLCDALCVGVLMLVTYAITLKISLR